jgi:cyclophilin family peptidyl-prolyl cis-trans isomerase/HEAT repeat protein
MRRGARAFGAAFLWAVAASRCASRVTPAAPYPARLPSPARTFTQLEEAEPELLALEDRRAFEPAALEAGVGSSSPPVRARTALALGRIADERARQPLSTLLSDSVPEVRETAAFAAGILGEPALSAQLAALLSDTETRVAVRAAWSLGVLEQSLGQDALVAAVPSARAPELRAAFLTALWHFATPAAAAAALPYVADPDTRIRAAALYALARRPQESSRAALTAALSDPDASTAAACARGLGLLGKSESIGPLAVSIAGSRTPVTIQAMLATKAILEKNPGAPLPVGEGVRLLALASDANPNVAVPALEVLRWWAEDREVFRRLWSVASSGQARRRQAALQSLMGALGSGAESLVDEALDSPDRFLRAAAAESLSSLPAPDASVRRARLAADPDVLVRLRVLEGLRTPQDVAGNRALVDSALADPDPGVRAAAIDALTTLGDPAALAIVAQALARSEADREPDVAIAAIGAAEKTPESPEARAVVEAAYRHPSTLVSRLARRSLVQTFHADPTRFPWREYVTGKDLAAYRTMTQAHESGTIRVETGRGAFAIRLSGADAPLTVANFLSLARRSFFDGAPIHRVVPNFVVQDGDPTGTGNGGPGYTIRDEPNTRPYETGTVGMALAGPDTGGSQWFVTLSREPHLDGRYTVFGQVVAGMDVVDRIEQGDRILRVTSAPTGR